VNFKHARWLKNYPDETGAFARLPWFARAAARQLQGACDGAGRIDVGEGPDETAAARLAATIAFRQGATRGDRRLMAMLFPLLFEEGYLVARGRFVVIRNFVAAQRRWDDDETTAEQRPSNEPTTKLQRPSNEAATTGERPSNEAATKPELTPRKHDGDDASARARAHGSVPFRDDTNTDIPPSEVAASAPSAPPASPKATATKPRAKRSEDPPPFPYLDALRALAPVGSTFLVPSEGDLDGGIIAAVRKRVRQFPELALWRGVGAFIAAGGVEFPTDLNASWVASSRFCDAVTAFRAWDAGGRGAIARRQPTLPTRLARPGPAPVSASFADDGADPYAEAVERRAAQTQRDAAVRAAGGSR
jgi:hypothetical protein